MSCSVYQADGRLGTDRYCTEFLVGTHEDLDARLRAISRLMNWHVLSVQLMEHLDHVDRQVGYYRWFIVYEVRG